MRNTADSSGNAGRSRVRSQMEDAERRERELLEVRAPTPRFLRARSAGVEVERWPIAFASCLAHGSGLRCRLLSGLPGWQLRICE